MRLHFIQETVGLCGQQYSCGKAHAQRQTLKKIECDAVPFGTDCRAESTRWPHHGPRGAVRERAGGVGAICEVGRRKKSESGTVDVLCLRQFLKISFDCSCLLKSAETGAGFLRDLTWVNEVVVNQ